MTYTTWAKVFWNRGSDFSPAWAVPAQQRPAAIHAIDFNSYWTGPWYPFQSKFWLLNWNTELWAAPAQDTASLHQSCGEAADPLLWTGSHDGDGIHGSRCWPELSGWFSLLLEVHVQKASSLQARGLLSICSPKRHRDGRRSSPFPREAPARGWGFGLRTCPGWQESSPEMNSACLAEQEGDLYVVCVCLLLELDRQLFCWLCCASAKRRARTCLVLKGRWRCGWLCRHLCCACRCLV